MHMFTFLSSLLDRGVAVVCALLFVQFPLFIQHYMQQLVGRTEELKYQIETLQHTAALLHKTLDQYILKFMANLDQDVVQQGVFMQAILDRYAHLSEALINLQKSSVYEKPFLFLYFYSHEVAISTWRNFKLGMLFTFEGAAYALLGLLSGFLLYQLCRKCTVWLYNKLAIIF